MTDNIDKNESGLAEALYNSYRANRQGVVKTSASKQECFDQNETQTPSNSELLYAQHQRKRTGRSEELSADSVLDIVRVEYDSDVMSRRDQPEFADSAPKIESISATEGRIGGEGDARNAADKRPNYWWIRTTVGVAAAVVLGILLIPQLMKPSPQSDNTPDTLPIALSNDALRAIEFIDPAGADSFGFSDDDSIAKNAFNTGVLNVELRLAVEGANQQLTKTLLKALLTSVAQQSAIASNTDNIQSSVQTVYDSIDAGTTKNDISIQVQNLLATVESSISEEKQINWYLAGSSVESIRIAAEIALEHSDVTALEQALTQGKTVIKPVGLASSAKQFSDLVNFSLVENEKFIQVNEIRKMAEDIKLVMQ